MHAFFHKVKYFVTVTYSSIRSNPRLKRKLILYSILLVVLILLDIALHLVPQKKNDSEALEQLAGELISYELQENSLSLHYTLMDCDSFDMNTHFDLDDTNIRLPEFTQTSLQSAKDTYTFFFTRLQAIHPEKLTEHEQFLYDVLYDSLESTCESFSYPYYSEPLSPSSGEQTSLLILLAEYRFETRDDIEHYLELLACIPDYFEDLIFYEQQKAAAGLFMSDSSARKLVEQCDLLCTTDSLSEHTHFLQTTFKRRVDTLVSLGVITQTDADSYTTRHDELLLHTVSPAYTALADGIFLLIGTGTNEQGLCYYDQGCAYYEHLLTSVTGSDRTPEDILLLLRTQFETDYQLFCNLVRKLQDTAVNSPRLSTDLFTPSLPFATPDEMLFDLQMRMKEDFPALSTQVTFEVMAVDTALSPYVSPAFYLTPPLDNYLENQIYINYGDRPDDLTLYTTLAHEGYPGHLYQTVYHDMDMNEDSLLPLEAMLSYGGYVEGWATYVEDMSYEYAAEILCECNGYSMTEAQLLTDFYKLNRRIQLCLYSILDVSIHYYGMTKPEAASLLNAYGISDLESITWIYEYIVEEPACYLKYYLGYLEICELKKTAQALWGDSYSDMKFHTFFLETGPAPFSILRHRISDSMS